MDHSYPALLLEPAEYYVEGEKPGPLKEPEQKADPKSMRVNAPQK